MIRIATYPRLDGSNRYFDLYYGALRAHGFELATTAVFNDDFLRQRGDEFDVLHVHWGHEDMWRCRGRGALNRARGLVGFWRYLRLAHRLGKKIVWTVHDLEPHDGGGLADRLGTFILSRMADVVICHSAETRERLVKRYWGTRRSVVLMPIGNYDGVFPDPRPRAETLASLDLDPARKTLVAVGVVRSYKGYDIAAEALKLLGPEYQLVLAGLVAPHYRDAGASVETAAAGVPNVRLLFRSVTDAEVSDLHGAADCVLLPYRWVTGSAALLTSLTLNRAVVATDLPFFRETMSADPDAAVFCERNNPAALADAIRAFFASDVAKRHAAARVAADRFAWSTVVKPVAERMLAVIPNARVPVAEGKA